MNENLNTIPSVEATNPSEQPTLTCAATGVVIESGMDILELSDGRVVLREFASATVVCEECGKRFLRREMRETEDGNYLCDDCFDSGDWMECDDCGRAMRVENSFVVNRGTRWETYVCRTCICNYYRCEDCGEYFSDRLIHTDDYDTVVCDACYENNWCRCDDCNRLISSDDALYSERRDLYLCYDCYHDEVDSSRSIHDYGYKPCPIFGYAPGQDGGFAGSPMLGVELECDKGDDPGEAASAVVDLTDRVYCKHDSSLNDGYEIVSHPGTIDWHMNVLPWADICDTSLEHGFKSHDAETCGLHVHIGRDYFAANDVSPSIGGARMAVLVERLWPELNRFSRRTNDRWASCPHVICEITDTDCEEAMARSVNTKLRGVGRYQAVNILPAPTIELRFFRGTLRYTTFIASLQLAHNIAVYCKSHTIKECNAASFEDVLSVREFPELRTYVAERFAGHDYTGEGRPSMKHEETLSDDGLIRTTASDGCLVVGDRVVVLDSICPFDLPDDVTVGTIGTVVTSPADGTVAIAFDGCTTGHNGHSAVDFAPAGCRSVWYVNTKDVRRVVQSVGGQVISTTEHISLFINGLYLGARVTPNDSIMEDNDDWNDSLQGVSGTVIGTSRGSITDGLINVCWDVRPDSGHSCDGRLPLEGSNHHHGWNMFASYLTRV